MVPIVVLAGDDASAEQFERAGVTVLRASDAEDAVRLAASHDVATVVLDRQQCGSLELVAAVSQLAEGGRRRLVVIDRAPEPDGDDLTRALRRQSHVQIYRGGADAAAALSRAGAGTGGSRTAGAFAASPGVPVAVLQPQLLPVVGAKGGVGKTTVAANLAALMVSAGVARTALADLAFTNSDVAVQLELPDGITLMDAIDRPESLADLPCCASFGLHVLPGVTKPEDAEKITQPQLEALIAGLRKHYDIVILDLASDPTADMLYHCIDQASAVILVSTLDAAALKNTRLFLNTLKRLNIKVSERVRLVLNRVRADATMDPARAEAFLGLPAACTIPDDPRSFDAAAFAGVPLTISRPNHAIAQALWQLAGSIAPALGRPSAPKMGGPWWRKRG